jgi:hypothetical protein
MADEMQAVLRRQARLVDRQASVAKSCRPRQNSSNSTGTPQTGIQAFNNWNRTMKQLRPAQGYLQACTQAHTLTVQNITHRLNTTPDGWGNCFDLTIAVLKKTWTKARWNSIPFDGVKEACWVARLMGYHESKVRSRLCQSYAMAGCVIINKSDYTSQSLESIIQLPLFLCHLRPRQSVVETISIDCCQLCWLRDFHSMMFGCVAIGLSVIFATMLFLSNFGIVARLADARVY